MNICLFNRYFFTFTVILLLTGCNRSPGNPGEHSATGSEIAHSSDDASISGLNEEESLRQSALDGDLVKVKDLLEAGINVNAPNPDGRTALMSAAYNGHSEIVMTLIEQGAVVDRRDLMGRTALLYAATGPFPETVRILLDKSAQPNIVDSDEHFSPLMHAAAEGNLEVVKVLLEYHADPSLTDVDGDDAESFARQAGHTAVAETLGTVR
ncbi:MAG: ankyrin repeat domain-containing protein [Bacteroidales bacterium]|nr:ankyrin repeat domain-containing protein [Bacteroidales bacterium]